MAGFAFTILTGMYFLPTILAVARGNRSTMGVGVLNFFAGWTLIGWVVALVWALCGERDCGHIVYVWPQQPQQQPQQWYVPPEQAQYVDRGGPPMNVTRGPFRP